MSFQGIKLGVSCVLLQYFTALFLNGVTVSATPLRFEERNYSGELQRQNTNDVMTSLFELDAPAKPSHKEHHPIRGSNDPVQTLLCMTRSCNSLDSSEEKEPCTWQMCQSLLKGVAPSVASFSPMFPSVSLTSGSDRSMSSTEKAEHDISSLEDELGVNLLDDNNKDINIQNLDSNVDGISAEISSEIGSQLSRRKRWQYTDALQVCVAQKCPGLKEVHFYKCVYNRCIAHASKER